MPHFPPKSPIGDDNIFRVAYWRALAGQVVGDVGVIGDGFWGAHVEAQAINQWPAMMAVLNELDTFLRTPAVAKEPQLYIYKTKAEQDLRDIDDWYSLGGLIAFRKYVYQQRYNGRSNAEIAGDLDAGRLVSPLGGHVGHVQAILDHLQDGPAILRFKMRPGAYSALFRGQGPLAFGTAAASLRHAARYLRYKGAGQYLVRKKTIAGAGEGYLAGWLGVKGEDEYVSFAIGDNAKSKALFAILSRRSTGIRRSKARL